MWNHCAGFFNAVLHRCLGSVASLTNQTFELFVRWQYVLQLEEHRGKLVQQQHRREGRREMREREEEEGHAADISTSRFSSSSLPRLSGDIEMCHRQAIAGLALLGQRVPKLIGGYYRPTLQSIYGKSFSSLAELRKCREVIDKNLWVYNLNTRGVATFSTGATTLLRANATLQHDGASPVEDTPLLIWLVMPWEDEDAVVERFVLRLAHSLGCDALFVRVPVDYVSGPSSTLKQLLSIVETGERKRKAQRVILGGCDLAAMFVLLLLEYRSRMLRIGVFAAADQEMARRAFCHGVILIDPFVGWEIPPPPPHGVVIQDPSASQNEVERVEARGRRPALSAKDRFKQLVMDESGGYIRLWFPSTIQYVAPPMLVLVDERGFWLEEQCAFNARVDRFSIEHNEERIFFLSYAIETAAVGRLVSLKTQVELDRLWRMVEKFLSNQLVQAKKCTTGSRAGEHTTPTTTSQRSDLPAMRGAPSRREGDVTFLAAFSM